MDSLPKKRVNVPERPFRRGLPGGKKGFTFIELVVMLCILAVLAAILIPLLFNYVEKSKLTVSTANAKSAYIAVSAILTTGADKPAANTLSLWNEAIRPRVSSNSGELTAMYFNADGSLAGVRWLDGNGKEATYGATSQPPGGSTAAP